MISFFWITIKYIKNQKFSAFDIVELRSKEMWSVSYVTCINIAQVYLTWWWSVFLFLDVWILKFLANQSNNNTDFMYKYLFYLILITLLIWYFSFRLQ